MKLTHDTTIITCPKRNLMIVEDSIKELINPDLVSEVMFTRNNLAQIFIGSCGTYDKGYLKTGSFKKLLELKKLLTIAAPKAEMLIVTHGEVEPFLT